MPLQLRLQIVGIDVYVDGHDSQTIVMLHGRPETCRRWDAQMNDPPGTGS